MRISLVLAAIVVVAGVGALVYGFVFHTQTVHFTETVEIEVPALEQDPFGDGSGAFPGEAVSPDGEPRMETIQVKEERTADEPEHQIVLEVTRGGVERHEDGRIARTYEAGQGPPSQCPT